MNTGSNNTLVGFLAGRRTTSAQLNTFVGVQAGYGATTGSGNTYVGTGAGYGTTTAGYNTFVGYRSGMFTTTGGNNTFLGHGVGPTTIVVAPDTPTKRAEYAAQVIRTFYVSHANVEDLVEILTAVVRVPDMPVPPQFVANVAANSITVRAAAPVASIIERVIAANDTARAEIVIDILEVNRERARQYGLDLSDYSVTTTFSPETAPGAATAADDPAASAARSASTGKFNLNTITSGVSLADFYTAVLAAVIRFLEQDTHTRLIAQPQLRGQEGAELTLNLRQEIPVPTTAFTPLAAAGAAFNPLTSFQYRPVGVILRMTPRVTYEDEIILDLEVENSTLGPPISVGGQSMPTFGTRNVETRLRLRDGESNLLAGLLRQGRAGAAATAHPSAPVREYGRVGPPDGYRAAADAAHRAGASPDAAGREPDPYRHVARTRADRSAAALRAGSGAGDGPGCRRRRGDGRAAHGPGNPTGPLNTMTNRRILVLPYVAAAVCAACDPVPLVAPTQSTLTLVAAARILPASGSTTVTARVVESAGTPVHDGTIVTFSAALGTIHPAEVASVRGRASATFTAGAASGVVELQAYSGDAVAEPVEVTIGAAAVGALRIAARPTSLPPSGGKSTVTATGLDSAQNPLPRVPVTFSTSAGTLRNAAATSDGDGNTRTVLTTTVTATVTATAGDDVQVATTIAVAPLTSINVAVAPLAPVVEQVVTFTVTLSNERHAIRRASIAFGDGKSQDLGAATNAVVTHACQQPGTYTVTVRATDNGGHETSWSTGVHVRQAPGISIGVTASPSSPVVGQPVTFNVTVTPPANGPAVRDVTIDFDDGSREALGALTGTTTTAHVYATSGSRIVTVTAVDTADRRYTASVGVTVAASPSISVSVSASPSAPVVDRPVTFTVTVTAPTNGPEVRNVTIDFDDGSDESLGALTGTRTVAHVYKRAGSYLVTVTARDTADRQSESSIGVTVLEAD